MPAATPMLLNVAMIGAIWALAPLCERWGLPPIYALAAGVMVGGVLQLAVQIPALVRAGCLPRIRLGLAALGEAAPPVLRQVSVDGAGAAGRLVADLRPDQPRSPPQGGARCPGLTTPAA